LKALVIGYGSIGARHARLLAELGCDTAVLSSRAVEFSRVFDSLATALESHAPDFVVVANPTSQHFDTLSELLRRRFTGTVLVEKPLFDRALEPPAAGAARVCVAYNLRFHPLISRLRELLRDERVLSVRASAGQYLPDWRPATDYRASYSASEKRGGGVLRDLSHELDYLTWMLGGWQRVVALNGRFSSLEITSDDVFACLLTTPACKVVSLHLDYLDRAGRRGVVVNTDRHTFEADFTRGVLRIDREEQVFKVERDDTYRAMHGELLAGNFANVCTLDEGMRTLTLIEAAQRSSAQGAWIAREIDHA
jgi:predicted dehydrogenase